jgi:hypothetical protein
MSSSGMWRHIPEDDILHSHRCESLKSYITRCKFLPILFQYWECMCRDSSVGIATGFGLDGRDSILGRSKSLFSTPQGPDRFRVPPSLLSNGYCALSPRGKSDRAVKLTSHLNLVSKSKVKLKPPLPDTSSWRDVWLINTWTTLPFYMYCSLLSFSSLHVNRTAQKWRQNTPVLRRLCGKFFI